MASVKFYMYVHLFVVIYLTHLLFGQDAELNILVCDSDKDTPGIFDIGLHAGKIWRLPIANVVRPVAIDYDPQTQIIYWTDVGLKQIRATNILGSPDIVLLNLTEDAIPDGIAIDTIHHKLFYTDYGNGVITSMNLNGSDVTTILGEGDGEPRAIVLHEKNRIIYWTDWGSNASISKANYDGTSRETIIDSGLIWPSGITLDKTRNILYWCDLKTKKIESFNIGTFQRTVLRTERSSPIAIFSHHDTLYFTERLKAVFSMPAGGGDVGAITHEDDSFGQLEGLHVFSNMNNTNCPIGQYGVNCEVCGRCKSETACNRVTGICLTGCQTGYVGLQCKLDGCPGNTYGDTCMPCGRCAGGVACDTQTGQCTGGCETGWTGDNCDRACSANTYGKSCLPCGRCAEGRPCDSVTGFCSAGCMEGWIGARCDTDAESQGSPIGLIVGVGVAVAVLVVIIIGVVILVLLRRKKKRDSERTRAYETLNAPPVYVVPRDLPPHYSTIGDIPPPTDDGYIDFGNVVYSPTTGTVGFGQSIQDARHPQAVASGVQNFPEKEPRYSPS